MFSNVTLECYNLRQPYYLSSTVLFQDKGKSVPSIQIEFGSEEFHKNIYSTELSDTST